MNRRSLLLGLVAAACSRSSGDAASGKAFPWAPDRLLAPAELARRLPPAKDSPLAELERRTAAFARDRELVIYCGCCPWKNCPNVRPAYEKLAQMHFTSVRVLDLPTTFRAGWTDQGFPLEKGA
jgi:hypothetical protein